MITLFEEPFDQRDGLGWCDYNGGIPNKPAPPVKYIIAVVNTKSQPFLGGDVLDAQYVTNVIDGEFITASYHDTMNIRQFNSEIEALDWITSMGVNYSKSGLQIVID